MPACPAVCINDKDRIIVRPVFLYRRLDGFRDAVRVVMKLGRQTGQVEVIKTSVCSDVHNLTGKRTASDQQDLSATCRCQAFAGECLIRYHGTGIGVECLTIYPRSDKTPLIAAGASSPSTVAIREERVAFNVS